MIIIYVVKMITTPFFMIIVLSQCVLMLQIQAPETHQKDHHGSPSHSLHLGVA